MKRWREMSVWWKGGSSQEVLHYQYKRDMAASFVTLCFSLCWTFIRALQGQRLDRELPGAWRDRFRQILARGFYLYQASLHASQYPCAVPFCFLTSSDQPGLLVKTIHNMKQPQGCLPQMHRSDVTVSRLHLKCSKAHFYSLSLGLLDQFDSLWSLGCISTSWVSGCDWRCKSSVSSYFAR